MKKIFLSLLLLTILLNANKLQWVDKQVDAIKPPRSGVSDYVVQKTNDPFIFLKKNATKNHKSKKTSVVYKNYKTKSLPYNSKKSSRTTILKTKPSYTNSPFVLGMIMNDSALINGKWKKVGDWIKNYKIIKISKSSVTLKQNSKTKVISLYKKNNNLKFKK